jgi:hypothetical protein
VLVPEAFTTFTALVTSALRKLTSAPLAVLSTFWQSTNWAWLTTCPVPPPLNAIAVCARTIRKCCRLAEVLPMKFRATVA